MGGRPGWEERERDFIKGGLNYFAMCGPFIRESYQGEHVNNANYSVDPKATESEFPGNLYFLHAPQVIPCLVMFASHHDGDSPWDDETK